MNTNTAIIGGVVIVVLLVGGIFFFTNPSASSPSTTSTSTPTGTDQGSSTAQTPGAPVAVTNSSVTPTNNTAVVVGGVVPNGALTTYWYQYGISSNLGTNSATQTIGSGYTTLAAPAYLVGLAKDTTYYFRLIAQNSVGESTGATYTFHTTTNTPAPVGSAPTTRTLAATSVSRTTANINGSVTPNQSSTQYWFEYGQNTNLGNITAVQSVGSGTASVPASISLSDLAPATTYYFRLNAQNQFGTINGAILNFKTAGPAASAAPVVTTQVASPIATTSATVRGTVNPSNTQTTYWFEYSTDSLLGSVLLSSTPQQSAGAGSGTVSVQANLSSLRANTTYYYRAVAQNAAGTIRGDNLTFKTN